VLVVAAWFLAPVIASFYREEAMVPLFRAASVVLVIHGFRLVPYRLLEKALDFKKKLVPAIAGSAAYFATAVLLASRGAGAWSLVGAEVASVVFETVVYWIVSPWRPTFRFSRRLALEDLSFGWIVVGGSALIFAFRSVDRIVISRFMGTHTLGIYAFAYSLANLPATLFVRALNTVLFPSYSSLGDDREQQRSLFLRATSCMAAAGLLYTTGIVFFGRYFLLATYGQKWIEAAVPLSILAFFALFRSLGALVGDLLVATGHPNTFRKITALQLVLAAGGLYFGATLGGMVGVALVMTAAQAISLVVGWISAARVVGARAGGFAQAVRGPIAAGVVASVASAFAVRLLPPEGNLPALLAAVACVVGLFFVVWSVLDAQLRSDLARALRRGEAT
jgi:PST family polysaccharide transporter